MMDMFTVTLIFFTSFVFVVQCSTAERRPVRDRSSKSSRSRRSRRYGKSSRSRKSSRSKRSSRSRKSSKSTKSSKSRKSSKPKQKVEDKSTKTAKSISVKSNNSVKSSKRVAAAVKADQQATKAAIVPKDPHDVLTSTKSVHEDFKFVNVRAMPRELNFEPVGGIKSLKLMNNTTEKKAFKVKCSDNMMYAVDPVSGVIDPKENIVINVLRENGMPKYDKMVIFTANVEAGDPKTELLVVPLSATVEAQ